MDKPRLLKLTLYFGAAYYLVGAFAHYFGVTVFPWYDGKLYTPYHDTVIAFVALVIAYFLIVLARDPMASAPILKAVIVLAFAASVFSIAIVWKVDFVALGAPAKELQTIVEGVLGFIWAVVLLCLYPRGK